MVFKKPIMIGFVVVAIALLATWAYAGWGGCCGYLWIGSLNFHWELQGGSKPEASSVLSTGLITEIGVTCRNNGGNLATAWAPRNVLSSVETDLAEATIGENGKIIVEGSFPDTWTPENPDTLCPNEQNWDAIDIVPTTVVWFVSVETEGKNNTKVWDEESYVCTYQGPYPSQPDNNPEDDYDCVLQ